MRMLNILCASFTIFFGLWIAYHLFYLSIYGSGVIEEPNQIIAIGELAVTLAVIAMAGYTWFRLAYRKR